MKFSSKPGPLYIQTKICKHAIPDRSRPIPLEGSVKIACDFRREIRNPDKFSRGTSYRWIKGFWRQSH